MFIILPTNVLYSTMVTENYAYETYLFWLYSVDSSVTVLETNNTKNNKSVTLDCIQHTRVGILVIFLIVTGYVVNLSPN